MKYLFERLVCDDAADATFDLKSAVRANVQRLVSNRILAAPADSTGELDVLNCGLPSIVDLPHGSPPALEDYCVHMRRLIGKYEPRLEQPKVEIEPADAAPFRVVVSAKLASGDLEEEIRFPVMLDGRA
ncbi:MAG: type VI secretion system baseplate subunit TssE [Sulfurifustaceae bacterium]